METAVLGRTGEQPKPDISEQAGRDLGVEGGEGCGVLGRRRDVPEEEVAPPKAQPTFGMSAPQCWVQPSSTRWAFGATAP